MNSILRYTESEGDVVTLEATDAKVDALRESVDEVKKDVREIRADVSSLRDQMHAGFAALRDGIAGLHAGVAELRATIKMMIWAISLVGMLLMIFLSAGKALHWFESPTGVSAQSGNREAPVRP